MKHFVFLFKASHVPPRCISLALNLKTDTVIRSIHHLPHAHTLRAVLENISLRISILKVDRKHTTELFEQKLIPVLYFILFPYLNYKTINYILYIICKRM